MVAEEPAGPSLRLVGVDSFAPVSSQTRAGVWARSGGGATPAARSVNRACSWNGVDALTDGDVRGVVNTGGPGALSTATGPFYAPKRSSSRVMSDQISWRRAGARDGGAPSLRPR
jgi:hypothetical protein